MDIELTAIATERRTYNIYGRVVEKSLPWIKWHLQPFSGVLVAAIHGEISRQGDYHRLGRTASVTGSVATYQYNSSPKQGDSEEFIKGSKKTLRVRNEDKANRYVACIITMERSKPTRRLVENQYPHRRDALLLQYVLN